MSHRPCRSARPRCLCLALGGSALLGACLSSPTPPEPATPTAESAVTPVAEENADADGDALWDVWETAGYDHDGDGTIEWDLAALGADPNKKDVFIEIDWLEGPAGHTHIPRQGVIQRAIQMFANAPVANPDGSSGISLHVELSNAIPEIQRLGSSFGSSGYDWSAFDDLKQVHFHPSKRPIWHYVIFGHNYGNTTSSGISRGIPGSDLLVTLGSFGETADEQTGTLVHELGHNLGLTHGGIGHLNFKPNYLSVMNYLYQMTGLCRRIAAGGGCSFGDFDYSRWDTPALLEDALSEPVGLGPEYADFGALYHCGGSITLAPTADRDIDWNCSGATDQEEVAEDINGDGSRTNLNVQSNWANLRFDGGLIGKGTDPMGGVMLAPNMPDSTQYEELTAEMYAEIQSQLEQTSGYRMPTEFLRAPPLATPAAGQVVYYGPGTPAGRAIDVPPELQSPGQRQPRPGATPTP